MANNRNREFPVIGISGTLLTIESGSFMGHERTAVVHDYIESIGLTGGMPIVLPVVEREELIEQQMALVDGLLLSGGYDVSPLFYKEEPLRGIESIRPDRDRYELQLIEIARKLGKPILGICRGMQILNVAFGGTLYQDIALYSSFGMQHNQKAKAEEASHEIQLTPNTKLRSIFEEETLLANSFHHQAIKELASDLIVNAQSSDGLIEGIESKEDPFIVGVQWHPEVMIGKYPIMFKLFHAFIEASKQRS